METIQKRSESEQLKRRFRVEFYEGSLDTEPTECFFSDEAFPAIHKGDLISPAGWSVVPKEEEMGGKIFEVTLVVHYFSQTFDECTHSLSVVVVPVHSPWGII